MGHASEVAAFYNGFTCPDGAWEGQWAVLERLTPGVKILLGVHAAVWLLTRPFLETFVGLAVMDPAGVLHGELWRLVSYPLVLGLWDLLWVGLTLFFFGPEVEGRLGTNKFLGLYAGAAAVSGVFLTLVSLVVDHAGMLLGPATADLALLAAFARLNPSTTLRLYFVLPVRAVHLLWFVLGIRVLSMWEAQRFLWAVVAELVAAAFGYFAVRGGMPWSWADINPVERFKNWQYRRRLMKFKVVGGGKRDKPDQWLH